MKGFENVIYNIQLFIHLILPRQDGTGRRRQLLCKQARASCFYSSRKAEAAGGGSLGAKREPGGPASFSSYDDN